MVKKINAFDGNEFVEIDQLSIDNAEDRVNIFGELSITRDILGLNKAEELLAVVEAVVKKLKAEKERRELPEILINKPPITEANPFFQKDE